MHLRVWWESIGRRVSNTLAAYAYHDSGASTNIIVLQYHHPCTAMRDSLTTLRTLLYCTTSTLYSKTSLTPLYGAGETRYCRISRAACPRTLWLARVTLSRPGALALRPVVGAGFKLWSTRVQPQVP